MQQVLIKHHWMNIFFCWNISCLGVEMWSPLTRQLRLDELVILRSLSCPWNEKSFLKTDEPAACMHMPKGNQCIKGSQSMRCITISVITKLTQQITNHGIPRSFFFSCFHLLPEVECHHDYPDLVDGCSKKLIGGQSKPYSKIFKRGHLFMFNARPPQMSSCENLATIFCCKYMECKELI